MKYFALIIAIICSIQLPAQNNLRKLNKQEREKYLVEKAKEVVQNFGPTYYREYGTPISTSYLLSNCGIPYAEQQEKAACLQARHEQLPENHELTQTTNCDRIYIVELPNVKNIEAHNRYPGIPCSKTITDLTAKAAKCYSVEFYKQTACEPLIMLFFINNSNTAIEECVAQIAQYIKFE